MKKFKLLPAIIAAASLFTMSTAFAEGSKDLVIPRMDTGKTSRPSLIYSTDSKNGGMLQRTVIYAYAKQGETIHFGTSVVLDNRDGEYTPNLAGYTRNNKPWKITNYLNTVTRTNKNNQGWDDYDNIYKEDDGKYAMPWTEDQWRTSTNPDKFATIAVTICDPDIPYYIRSNAEIKDFVEGEKINTALTDYKDLRKVQKPPGTGMYNKVYLFTADSGQPDQFKYTYEDTEKALNIIRKEYRDTGKDTSSNSLEKSYAKDVRPPEKGVIGYIENPAQEAAGPKGVIPFGETKDTVKKGENGEYNPDGYNSLSFVAPITGTYAFRFFANDAGGSGNLPQSILDTESDINADTNKPNYMDTIFRTITDPTQAAPQVGMWDVTVVETATKKAQSGRVWSDALHLNMGLGTAELASKVYVLTQDGFEYLVDFNGMRPFGFTFFSNSRGFLLKTIHDGVAEADAPTQSLNHSFFSLEHLIDGVGDPPERTDVDFSGSAYTRKILLNTTPTDRSKDFNHRVYFNQPDADSLEEYTGKRTMYANDSRAGDTDYAILYTGEGCNSFNNNPDNPKQFTEVTDKNNGNITKTIPFNSGTEGIGGKFTVVAPATVGNDGKPKEYEATKAMTIRLDFSDYELDSDGDGKPVRNADGEWQKWEDNKNRIPNEATDYEAGNVVVLTSNNFTPKKLDNPSEYGYVDAQGNIVKTPGWYYVCEIDWDGRDAYNHIVPPGIYKQVITSYWQSGTAHFPLLDVEYAQYGIKAKMLNDVRLECEENRDKIYYNNTGTSGTGASAWYFYEKNRGATKGSKEANYHTSSYTGINMFTTNFNIDNEKESHSKFINPALSDKLTSNNKNALNGIRTYYDEDNKDYPYTIAANTGTQTYRSDIYKDNETGEVATGTTADIAPGDHTAIDIWMRYTTEESWKISALGVNPNVTDRAPITPYVSFVGETEEDKISIPSLKYDPPAENNGSDAENSIPTVLGTHVGFYDNNTVKYDTIEQGDEEFSAFKSGKWDYKEYEEYGSDKNGNHFGNTISTEFVVDIQSDYAYDKVRWTIVIPAKSTFVKAAPRTNNIDVVGLTMTLSETDLKDTDATKGGVSLAELDYNNAEMETAVDMESGKDEENPESFGDEILQVDDANIDGDIFFTDDSHEDFRVGDEDIPEFGFFADDDESNGNGREIGPPKVNAGWIYSVSGFTGANKFKDNNDDEYGLMRFKYKLPVTVYGDIKVVFGLVIDNLYAPQAVATEVEFDRSDRYTADENYTDLRENSHAVWAESTPTSTPTEDSEESEGSRNNEKVDATYYYKNENNEYWPYDPENPINNPDSSENR